MINKKSKHKVFSKLRIMSVISVTVEKKWGYGYLKEIVIKRASQRHYKFKEDTTLCHCMKSSPEIIESYQEILIRLSLGCLKVTQQKAQPYSSSKNCPHHWRKLRDGISATSVHKTLHTRLQNLSLGFNPKSDMPNRSWKTKDQDCTTTILKKIDLVLLKRRIMRSLEVLVSGRKIETDK
ncbi:hypothetical protein Tco_1286280 [Tanacetum coccineum]